jgi:predicted transcriptional regulator
MKSGLIHWDGNTFKPLKNLVEDIKNILLKLNWSDSKLAKKSGIEQSTISRILIGVTTNPAYTTIEAIVYAIIEGIKKHNGGIMNAN